MLRLRIVLLLCLVTGTLTQDLSLWDALDDDKPAATEKPKEQPKAPEKPKDDGGFVFDLEDALGPDPPKPAKPTEKPNGGGGGFGFDLGDALGPDPNPKPAKPTFKPPRGGGGGGTFDDSDLAKVDDGTYEPDGGRVAGGGAVDPGRDSHGGADQPQEAGSGQIAGIASAIGMALLGAASSYFAYQKKKLCFKMQGGADPERGKGHHGNRSDGTQIFSNLLRTS